MMTKTTRNNMQLQLRLSRGDVDRLTEALNAYNRQNIVTNDIIEYRACVELRGKIEGALRANPLRKTARRRSRRA